MSAPQLRFGDFAGGLPYHAAFAALRGARGDGVEAHRHDFWESFCVLEGRGIQRLAGHSQPLESGSLVLVRPWDSHAIVLEVEHDLHFINIAFPQADWEHFVRLTTPAGTLEGWSEPAPLAPRLLSGHAQDTCTWAFRSALDASLRARSLGPSSLERGRLWLALLEAFTLPPASAAPRPPRWLHHALEQMTEPQRLRSGLPELLRLSRVSPTHLARSVRAHYGQSPTEKINALRLEAAAHWLGSSALEIQEVALECGFENLSYFYRLFRARYGLPPQAYRERARRAVAP